MILFFLENGGRIAFPFHLISGPITKGPKDKLWTFWNNGVEYKATDWIVNPKD